MAISPSGLQTGPQSHTGAPWRALRLPPEPPLSPLSRCSSISLRIASGREGRSGCLRRYSSKASSCERCKVLDPAATAFTRLGLPDFNGFAGRESGRTEQKGEGKNEQSYHHHKAPSCVGASLLQKHTSRRRLQAWRAPRVEMRFNGDYKKPDRKLHSRASLIAAAMTSRFLRGCRAT